MDTQKLYDALNLHFIGSYWLFANDPTALNGEVIDRLMIHPAWKNAVENTVEDPCWIAWECFISIVEEIAQELDMIIIDNSVRYAAGEWFTGHFGDHHVALADSVNYINIKRNAHIDNEERKVDTMLHTTIENNENEIICSACGCIITGEDHEVNGDHYCDDCFNERFITCTECGEIVERDDAWEYDGDWYCEDCFNENFAICSRCGEVMPIDDATEVEGSWYCEDCCDRYFRLCEHCGDWVRRYNIYTVAVNEDGDTEDWCEDCFENNSWYCEECETTYSDDVERDDEGLCPNCSSRCAEQNTGNINDWRAPRGVRSYGYKPDPCMCKTLDERSMPNLVFYGFELEVDKAPCEIDRNEYANVVNDNSGYTYVKHDGSLDNGMEIVSHPATLAYHMAKKDDWSMIFDELLSAGFTSHDAKTCGLHIHISKAAMEAQNPNAINNLLFLMDHFWDKLVRFSRRTESQLSRWARRYSTFHGDFESWKKQAKDTRDRYYALNLQNKHTVEIRMFRGTLNLDTFMATLQLVDTLVKRCIEITDLRRLQAITWEELVQSDWLELNDYLVKRGLGGTPEQVAAYEAEERRKEEERRKAEEERRRREEEANRIRLEFERQSEQARNERLNALVGHQVMITSAPDHFTELVGHTGRVVAVDVRSRYPLAVDFRDELPEDFLGVESVRSLHDCWGRNSEDVQDPGRHSFWFCPIESVSIIG